MDHIDVATARQRGILVSNTPGVVTEDTADMTLALMLAVMRRMPEGLAEMQAGTWKGWAPMAHLGGRLAGRRLGILGMGRIGQAVARRARAFGMQIHYHNRRTAAARGRGGTGGDLLGKPGPDGEPDGHHQSSTARTRPRPIHLMNARRLKLMKPSAVIVNTSRGEVIDENALTRGLRAGELAGAGLDVFEHGHEINPRLRELPNVVLLPHMGSATVEGRVEMGEKVIINIKTFADGHRPPDQVVPGML